MKKRASLCIALIWVLLLCLPGAVSGEGLYDVSPILCHPSPSVQAQELMNWMCDNYGKKMISGQYLDEWQRGQELTVIAEQTGGLYPALLGLDFLNCSPSSRNLGTHSAVTDMAIDYWNRGYLITFCWHWVPPEKYLDTSGTSWWGGFRTENTSIDLEKCLNGEDPEGYDLLLRDMDAIALELQKLRDAGVPVLWRPLHEASGGWFWWGASGADAYIRLYRLMYERYTREFGLNNLLWIWNGQDALWYPGDDVVDIIGEDLYPGRHAHDTQAGAFSKCRSYTQAKKLIMMSECGCIPSPIKCERDQVMWSAWCVWCYEFVLDGQGGYSEEYTSSELLKRFYEADPVITLKDVPAFGRTPDGTPTRKEPEGLRFLFTDAKTTGHVEKTGDALQIRGNETTDTVTLMLNVPETGDWLLRIRQAGIGGYKENDLLLDGVLIGKTVVQGEAEEECDTGPVHLEQGTHELTVRAVWGWVTLLDLILIPQ